MYSQDTNKYLLKSILYIEFLSTKVSTIYYPVSSYLQRYIDVDFLKFLFSLHLWLYYLSFTEMYSTLKSFTRPACIHKLYWYCSHQAASSTFCFFLSQVKCSHISLMRALIVWSISGLPWIYAPVSPRHWDSLPVLNYKPNWGKSSSPTQGCTLSCRSQSTTCHKSFTSLSWQLSFILHKKHLAKISLSRMH